MKYQAIDGDYIREMKEYNEFLKEKDRLYKGLKYGYFIAIFIILLSAFLNGNMVLAQPVPFEYTFENNELYNQTDIFNATTFNIRNQTEYTFFNGTYSFETPNELDDWILYEIDPLINITIIDWGEDHSDNKRDHSNVVFINDTSNTGIGTIQLNNFGNISHGTIEFWIYDSDTTKSSYIHFLDDTTIGIYFYTNLGNLLYHDGSSHIITAISSNQWHHIRVDFETENGGYLGLAPDTFAIWIDFVEFGHYNFHTVLTNINKFHYGTSINNQNPELYFDAFGYSWDPYYEIGDNINNLINNNLQEADKWEFSFTEAGIYTEYETTPPFWNEIESSTYVQDGYFKIFDDTSATTDLGLYKDDFSITEDVINVSLEIEYEQSRTEEAVFYLKLFSADTTEIVRLRMYSHLFDSWTINTLSYWNGSTYNNVTTLIKDVIYSFNIFINDNIIILLLDGIQIATFETLANKEGLSEVRFHGNGGQYGDGVGLNRYVEIKIYSIGVYSEGISVSNDYYSSFFSTNLDWDSNIYNIFTADIIGNCSIVVGSTIAIGSPHTLFEYRKFTEIEIKNVWDEFTGGNEIEGWITLQDFNLTITSNSTIILNSMSISGIKLTEGLNTYYMDFDYSGINIDESYFYVSENNLHFSLTTDDTNLEYIQASFDISNLYGSNRSLFWKGIKSASILEAEIQIVYTDTSHSPFVLSPNYKSLTSIFPQSKTIDTFDLIITDNDSNVNDTITGYIGSFIFLYNPLVTTDFVSLSFFEVLPIVFLVVILPIALYIGFGKRKEILVPSIMAMSIFGTVIGLVPLWLTFVICFGCVSTYLIDKKKGG